MSGWSRAALEQHTGFLPLVARAVQFYLCRDAPFHAQLWEPSPTPASGHSFRLVWSKVIIPDINSGGGYRKTVIMGAPTSQPGPRRDIRAEVAASAGLPTRSPVPVTNESPR